MSLADHPTFQADYQVLRQVPLNPERHTARNAFEHCEAVRRRAQELARLNNLSTEETALLGEVALAHDIGKIRGTANPSESVALLASYGEMHAELIEMVKYHDVSLSWHLSARRGEPPSDKAWRRLARRVNVRLLALFMIADRADCPGGWQANAPLVWFLDQLRRREILEAPLAT